MRLALISLVMLVALWQGDALAQIAHGGCLLCRDDCAADHGKTGSAHHEGDCPTPSACSCCSAQAAAAPRTISLTTHLSCAIAAVPPSPDILRSLAAPPPADRPPIS